MKITKSILKQLIKEELDGPAALGPGMDLDWRQCKGTKQWYAGSCRYPGEIEKLKATESESTHVKTPYEKEFERAGRATMAAPGPFKDLPSAEAGGWDDPPVGKPGYKGKPRLEGPHAQSVKQYHALANAALRGSRKALRILKKYAAASPDAKAILDAVYEENAGLQLSRLGPSAAELEVAQLEENSGKGKTKMKLTKNTLKQLIRESLDTMLLEAPKPKGRMSASTSLDPEFDPRAYGQTVPKGPAPRKMEDPVPRGELATDATMRGAVSSEALDTIIPLLNNVQIDGHDAKALEREGLDPGALRWALEEVLYSDLGSSFAEAVLKKLSERR